MKILKELLLLRLLFESLSKGDSSGHSKCSERAE